jgi:hypothetical protein
MGWFEEGRLRSGLSAVRSGRRDDRARGEEPVALLLVDPELGQQPMPDDTQGRFDRRILLIGQSDRSAGTLVVAPRISHAVNDRLEDLSGPTAELPGPQ